MQFIEQFKPLHTDVTATHIDKNFHGPSGQAHRFAFPNGFGASVVKHDYSYGGSSGLWELAVLDSVGELNYTHPEARGDVRGYLTDSEVCAILKAIAG